MKIAIVGCGALGSYYGAKLCRDGQETHFLLRRGDAISPDEMLGPSSPPRTFDSSSSKNSSFNSLKNAIVGPVTVTSDETTGMVCCDPARAEPAATQEGRRVAFGGAASAQ